MTLLKLSACALALATAIAPSAASARNYYYDNHHHRHYYSHQRHYSSHGSGCHNRHATNGTIIGAIGGGLVGNAVSHGNRLPGTALGAGVGALAGHAVGARSGC